MSSTKNLAVILSAYRAENYISETITSLYSLSLPDGWNVNFYIGVDGCEATSRKLNDLRVDFFYSSINVNTYVMANSLINLAKKDGYDILTRFDADDIPGEDYFLNGIGLAEKHGYVRSLVLPFVNKNNRSINDSEIKFLSNGQFFVTKDVFDLVNGFDNYPVSGDYALLKKMGKLGYDGLSIKSVVPELRPYLFKRRHKNALTANPVMGLRTQLRKNIEDKIHRGMSEKVIRIEEPESIELKSWGPST
jgi:hypothetical protein